MGGVFVMISDRFEKAYEDVLNYEGGYINHPSDSGGATRYGITQRVAREFGYYGDMRHFPLDKSKEIYYQRYWKEPNFDLIDDEEISIELFEQGVNMGTVISILNLQRTYNLLSDKLIKVDGILGSNTAGAINKYRYPDDIFLWLNIYQGMRYINLANSNSKLKDFIRGWGKRVVLQRK